ncbi:MAG: TRAP transporter large permease [Planctomycetota bacterium]|jgi:tripartite ATP-independent transporter DctM subunit|nr:TRAP transporter large permease [Planctomycetota bacterium]
MSNIAIPLAAFFVLLAIGLPISFVLGISSVLYCVATGQPEFLFMVAEKVFRGMDNFVLLAIPLFILTGEIMNRGGITNSLVRFADLLVGRIRGGLAYVNILASTFFAGITGSALSDIASLGTILIPAMEEQGYDREFSCSVTAASALQGPLIPPSIPAVLVASATGMSTGALFLGSAVPGLMLGLGCAVITYFIGRRRHFPKRSEKIPFPRAVRIAVGSFFPLMTTFIILGGMVSGLFTPTEAAVVAVVYASLVTCIGYNTPSLSEIYKILCSTIIQSGKIYMIIGFATTFSWVLAIENIPNVLSELVSTYASTPLQGLIVINLLLLFWGMWMDTAPSILILLPILYPITQTLNIHPVHFGVIVVFNLMVGLLTPPFGMALFTTQSVGKISLQSLLRGTFPFILMDFLLIVILILFPQAILALPRFFGLI